jgi:hypothetical protein
MRAKLIALCAVITALGIGPVGTAFAADQTASNTADAGSTNTSATFQGAGQEQSSSSDCKWGCGGSGQAQELSQSAETGQFAFSGATADQTAINANVPVTISAGDVSGGDNSATQDADNTANANSTNDSTTFQGADQSQDTSSKCGAGCGGSGQAQALEQDASTHQFAGSKAEADQTAINANVPVTISGGDVSGGHNSADQQASNEANADSTNTSATKQFGEQEQSSSSACKWGCGGSGQAQKLDQSADTRQFAFSKAEADQTAINANVPVTISAGDVSSGHNSATQHVENSANANSSNESTTKQDASQSQDSGSGSHCGAGCGGSGQAQELEQSAHTWQKSFSWANAWQEAVNVNSPVTVTKGKKAKKAKKAKHGKKCPKGARHSKK